LTSPIGFFDLGQTLAMEGFDVDMIPYGQAVSYEDLQNTDIVVVLPVMDFPGQAGNGTLYDEAWSLEELDAIERYVAEGGLVVLTNSAHRLTFFNTPRELNEDWIDVNRLSERLGIHYKFGTIPDSLFWVEKGSHPLVEGLSYLEICADNGVPISLITEGTVLAWVGNQVVMGLVEAGEAGGQVLALADIGILNGNGGSPKNLKFWQNLARYARSR
jgi:hypothetical protein